MREKLNEIIMLFWLTLIPVIIIVQCMLTFIAYFKNLSIRTTNVNALCVIIVIYLSGIFVNCVMALIGFIREEIYFRKLERMGFQEEEGKSNGKETY